jgi:hypothetical protein
MEAGAPAAFYAGRTSATTTPVTVANASHNASPVAAADCTPKKRRSALVFHWSATSTPDATEGSESYASHDARMQTSTSVGATVTATHTEAELLEDWAVDEPHAYRTQPSPRQNTPAAFFKGLLSNGNSPAAARSMESEAPAAAAPKRRSFRIHTVGSASTSAAGALALLTGPSQAALASSHSDAGWASPLSANNGNAAIEQVRGLRIHTEVPLSNMLKESRHGPPASAHSSTAHVPLDSPRKGDIATRARGSSSPQSSSYRHRKESVDPAPVLSPRSKAAAQPRTSTWDRSPARKEFPGFPASPAAEPAVPPQSRRITPPSARLMAPTFASAMATTVPTSALQSAMAVPLAALEERSSRRASMPGPQRPTSSFANSARNLSPRSRSDQPNSRRSSGSFSRSSVETTEVDEPPADELDEVDLNGAGEVEAEAAEEENSVPNRRPVDVLDALVEDLTLEPEDSANELERRARRKAARLAAGEGRTGSGSSRSSGSSVNVAVQASDEFPLLSAPSVAPVSSQPVTVPKRIRLAPFNRASRTSVDWTVSEDLRLSAASEASSVRELSDASDRGSTTSSLSTAVT